MRLIPAAALALTGALASGRPADAQPFKPKPSKVSDAEVEQAIQKGMAWLKAVRMPGEYHGNTTEEIVLYTLFHGGCPKDDPVFQACLKAVVDMEPSKTYNAAVAAMCLSELDKAGYRWKLEQIAQFLADNQCKNGQWSYGEPVPPAQAAAPAAPTPPPAPAPVIVSGPGEAQIQAAPALYGTRAVPAPPPGNSISKPGKTTALKRKLILQRRRGPASGDNSNSQYAALGLRACAEAGIVIDPKCVQDALNWWVKNQGGDGGWAYNDSYVARRGSMTAGGVGAVAIYRWMLRQPWKSDPAVARGMQWLHANWDVTKNPRGEDEVNKLAVPFQYYFLYGVERAGMLAGTDSIGTHDWYGEGAAYLLKSQTPEGMWFEGDLLKGTTWAVLEGHWKVWDTCFAILFLRRATQPLPPKIFTE